MSSSMEHSNRLIHEKSPYLLQHAHNPVDWFPWGEEAFAKAKQEDKPVFLSIGYSTCHWCHVMAHESFEDPEIADFLNQYFVSIKVDKEERPDIDSVYMAVCQAFTSSGGWPTSIFMTPDQKPFFAGTYFPKMSRPGSVGFYDLLQAVQQQWEEVRETLTTSAAQMLAHLTGAAGESSLPQEALGETAYKQLKQSFDSRFGGFGQAPKFPTPHNLLFLLDWYEKHGDREALTMAETTLTQLYRGGIYDHIGFGFCRYSTDRYFLVPHFEKMLYDNALLILAYSKAFSVTGNPLYKKAGEETADYILREMTDPQGGFYCAQDADSEGVEGKYYVFTPDEVISLLGEETGNAFNKRYDISKTGNFEGKNIPNLLHADLLTETSFDRELTALRSYRKERCSLGQDDKILTAWNGLMIAALARLFQATENQRFLQAAKSAWTFLEKELLEGETIYSSFRDGQRGAKGFLDDYAFSCFALLALYDATLEETYLSKAQQLCEKAVELFRDEKGGYFLSGTQNEPLILKPKETYDGAIPSGNSVMAYNLVRLCFLSEDDRLRELAEEQLAFLSARAGAFPAGNCFFLLALSQFQEPPAKVTVVLREQTELAHLAKQTGSETAVKVLRQPTAEYPLLNQQTTYYVCKNHSCLPPTNQL